MSSFLHRILFALAALGFFTTFAPSISAQSDTSAVSPWQRVSEGPITIYTKGNIAQATSLLHSVALLRNALNQASTFHSDEAQNLKIIVFNSEKEFSLYRLNPGSCAFFQQTRRSEYVVLQDLAPEHREVSLHEFTHFVIAHSGVTIPLWLNEGVADFYSTTHFSGSEVIFGRSVPGRLAVLRTSTWLPLNNLFDISTTSSYYSDPDRMALFYSESWALAHMLVASPSYGPRFPDFIRALTAGHTAAESLQLVYGKAVPQVQADLTQYIDAQHLPLVPAHLAFTPDEHALSPVSGVSGAEMDIALADLNVTNPHARTGLENRLANASSQLPGSAEAEEALGYLALRQGKQDAARAHFQQAVDRHTTDPNVIFYLAHLNHACGAPSSQVIPLLEQALALKPDLADARLELALIHTSEGNFTQALDALQNLNGIRPENAYAAAYTQAYCYAHVDKFSQALTAVQQAQSLAASDHDRAESSQLHDYITEQANY